MNCALHFAVNVDRIRRDRAVHHGLLADLQPTRMQVRLNIAIDRQRPLTPNRDGLPFDGKIVADH